jgi:hypothetical protein
MATVEVKNAHGTFTITADDMDAAIAKYLSASPYDLCYALAEATGYSMSYYDDVTSVSELLVMLKDTEKEG